MLEKLLKELGKQGYEVSWRYNVMMDCIDIRLERRFNKQWYKLNRMVTFTEIYDIPGGQLGFEFAMTQNLRWMVDKIEHDAGKHDGYFAKPFLDESEALRSPTDGPLPSSDHY